ncbi:hypothetical protein [Streptomyces sp. NPDC127038]|uniref:hypothetical protein n=1 Tax=Streptomyces sp. NPDC127038 TaxID=3347114 RepID=UPI00365F0ACA
MAAQEHGARVRVLYDSDNVGTVERLVETIAQTGLQPELSDLRYITRISDICTPLNGDLLCIVDESVSAVKRNLLLGYAMGAAKAIILVSEDHQSLPNPTQRIRVTSYEALVEEIVRLRESTHDAGGDYGQVQLFAHIGPDEPVAMVCAEIPEELRPSYAIPTYRDFLRYATFADIDALIQLMVWFAASKHRSVEAYTSGNLPDSLFAKHMLVVGGPAWNKMAQTLYRIIPLPVEQPDGGAGNPDPIVEKESGETWGPELTQNGEVISDVGFVSQVASPFHPGRTVTIFGGVLTHGVEAGVKIFTDSSVGAKNWGIIKPLQASPATGFLAVFRAKVVANNNVSPDLTRPDVLLAAYSYRAGEFHRVFVR